MDTEMEHDEHCHLQDRDLALLKEQFRRTEELFHAAAAQAQELSKQLHAQNIAYAEMRGDVTHIKGKVDDIEKSLEKDFALRSEFVEVKGEWRKFLAIVLLSVLTAILSLVLVGVKGGLR